MASGSDHSLRYYTDMCFLPQYAEDIRGHVLEIGDSRYTFRFGGQQVVHSDVLHAKAGNKDATIIADIAEPGGSLLLTVPGISQIARYDDHWGDYWRFTSAPYACCSRKSLLHKR